MTSTHSMLDALDIFEENERLRDALLEIKSLPDPQSTSPGVARDHLRQAREIARKAL